MTDNIQIDNRENTLAMLAQLSTHLYSDFRKSQNDFHSLTSQYRGKCRELTEREGQITTLRRQLTELGMVVTTYDDEKTAAIQMVELHNRAPL